jgi:hypothetical protein
VQAFFFNAIWTVMDITLRHTIETYGQLHLMLRMLPTLKNVNTRDRNAINDAIQRAIERLEGVIEHGK